MVCGAAFMVLLGAARPAAAAVDPKIVEALTWVRDASDDRALWDYIRKDPIPVVFARLPLGVAGAYVRSRGRAWIELSNLLQNGPAEVIGRELYHQYIHRLQDRSPERIMVAQTETAAGYAVAMRYLRSTVRRAGPTPKAPPEVRAAFGEPVWTRHARLNRTRGRGTTILVYRR